MSKVLVWDGDFSFGAEEVASSIALTHSLIRPKRVLLTHTGYQGDGVEEGFGGDEQLQEDHYLPLRDEGMDSLRRMSYSGRLSVHNFANYTLPILKGSLDLARGTRGEERIEPSDMKLILEIASSYYDLAIVKTTDQREAAQFAQPGDVGIVVLRQSTKSLDAFYAQYGTSDTWNNIPLVVVIHQFDPLSVYSVRNVRRKYGCKAPFIGVPYSTQFQDAWNIGEVVAFFHRYITSKNQPYIAAIQDLLPVIDKRIVSWASLQSKVGGA